MSFPNPDNYARDCDCGTAGANTTPPPATIQADLDSLDTRVTSLEETNDVIVSASDIASLTTAQQALIREGSIVTTTDGRRWVYSGAGSKVLEASYIELSDLTIGSTANLPLITGSGGLITAGTFGTTTNSFCQGNDTRLDRSAFIATWLSGGTPGYRNMANNTLELINFNTTALNTDNTNYSLELGNTNNAIDGKIRLEKTGTYLVNLIYNTFDISPGAYYSFYIFTNGTSKSTASSHSVTLFDQEPAGGSVVTGARYLFGGMAGIVNVNVAPLWVSLVFRPTAGNPYPTDGTSGTTTQPSRVEIIKVT